MYTYIYVYIYTPCPLSHDPARRVLPVNASVTLNLRDPRDRVLAAGYPKYC